MFISYETLLEQLKSEVSFPQKLTEEQMEAENRYQKYHRLCWELENVNLYDKFFADTRMCWRLIGFCFLVILMAASILMYRLLGTEPIYLFMIVYMSIILFAYVCGLITSLHRSASKRCWVQFRQERKEEAGRMGVYILDTITPTVEVPTEEYKLPFFDAPEADRPYELPRSLLKKD